MNGQQIIDNCRDIAAKQFSEVTRDGLLARALYENELLRSKILELANLLSNVTNDRSGT